MEKVTLDDQQILSIANYEISGNAPYYWLAPNLYLGNKLIVYGSIFTFRVIWIVMRGDTSGKPTKGPSVVLVGRNGKKIAYGNELYSATNMTFRVPMIENDWYYLDSSSNKTIEVVNRSDFLSILTDIKHILLRAKFHADQIEVALEEAVFNVGAGVSLVEECSCPSGYTGTSCESCDYGYVRILANSSAGAEQSFCGKCDCNGHSETCDPDTGRCICQHSTTGENCDRCLPGFYGNPMIGTAEDCKQCACPLLNEENNFSPSCQLDLFNIGIGDEEPRYVCTQCPKGYTGDHCEICDDGYFGSPTIADKKCEPCNCGGNPCERKTGQCLACKGNTEGWRCEKCISGYYGNPAVGTCQACLCDPIGSKSEVCDNVTGQCGCKEKFIGRSCDTCIEGYGNKTAGCVNCDCNVVGSKSTVCDSVTGLCDCLPGVEGFHCDACQHLHYGFSELGCQSCNCNPKGSELTTCDIKTGNCRCKLNYIGRTCDKCESGYWENTFGCVKCDCNAEGSRTFSCDHTTGYCYCKDGIGGEKCNICIKGYYGFSKDGCKQCDDCKKPGHICDSKTGRCVCPPNSHGVYCEKCLTNTWGHEPHIGCKECNCSKFGTKKQECDLQTGQCFCDVAYAGQNCDKCAPGYYGYPKCRPCNCNKAGTRCSANLCQCNEYGQCPCKKNVIGRTCNTCKEETFGLDISNPNGCTECFCFGRSKKCINAPYIWDQIPSNQIISDTLYRKRNSLYWRLPQMFNGDRLLSYNGYLRFKIEAGSNNMPTGKHDPFIILEGNRVEINRFQLLPQIAQKYEIHMQEDMWRTPSNAKISRMDFMVILQNISDIFIKATDAQTSDHSILVSVTLDTATEARGSQYRPAIGIEICECPTQYTSTSCQTPSPGYCRKRNHHTSIFGKINIDHVIGRSIPCECNERSKICDSETCKCQNCTDNTDGSKCEICQEGYFGNASNCRPCPCPTKDKNFAVSCDINLGICVCKPGYVGPKCATCAEGHYGNPMEERGDCKPCECNPQGIFQSGCDSSGQCYCKAGITGKKCSSCEESRHVLQNNVCVPCDDCTQKLLDQVGRMENALYRNTSHLLLGKLEPPWGELERYDKKYMELSKRFKVYSSDSERAKNIIGRNAVEGHYNELEKIKEAFELKKLKIDILVKDIISNNNQRLNTANEITNITYNMEDYIHNLNNFGRNHVSTREAVKEGETSLKHIQHQHKKVARMDVNSTLAKCMALSNFLETINKNNQMDQLMILNDILNNITDFLNSINKLLSNTSNVVKFVENKNLQNEDRLNRVKVILLENENQTKMIETELKTTNDNIKKANKIISEAESLMVKAIDEYIEDVVNNLDRRQKDLTIAIRFLKERFSDARHHTKALQLKVKNIEKIFEKNDKQVNAEKASEAYSNIVALLKAANETAQEATRILNNLKDQTEPKGMDSLSDKIYMLSANASQLESRILSILNHKAPDIKGRMKTIENRLNEIKNKNWYNGITLNRLIDEPLPEYDNMNMKNIINDALATSDRMKEIYKEAADIKNVRIPYDLRKNLDKLKSLTSHSETKEIQRKINEAKNRVQDMLRNFTEIKFNKETDTFSFENRNISLKLEELKAKIKKSKEIADGIRVSMSGQSCTRSYKLNNLEPSLVTNLRIKFSRNSTYMEKSASLFYVYNSEGQFMNLIVTKDSIIFFLKLSPTEKETKLVINTSEEECNINVERMFNIIKITVNNQTEGSSVKSGNIRFNISPANLIHVGNAPDLKGLPGCIHDITFNGKKIGLWQFEQTDQCEGCSRSIIISSTPTYRFNGEGFSMIKDTRNINPRAIGINFWFTTFDENALLFLSPHHESGSFLALTLHNGHIRYEVHYNRSDIGPIVLKTVKKYNDGIKHNVDVVKFFDGETETSKLVVDKEHSTDYRIISQSQLLKIKRTNLYIGGVSPDYFLEENSATDSLHTHLSFLGDIENFKLSQFIALAETSKSQHQYGVQFTDKPLEFRKVWLEGAGYLKLKPQLFKPTFGLVFVLRTTSNNSFIMSIDDLATFLLKDGYLNVNVDDKTLSSKKQLNDDDYHVVELIKRSSQAYVLKIDNTRADKQELLTSDNQISVPIFIGGIPNITNPEEYFNGEISDIFIDRAEPFRLLHFGVNTVDNFNRVKIGRGRPMRPAFIENDEMIKENLKSRPILDFDTIKDQQSIEGCDKNTNNSLELNAAKFGDMPESYVKYYLKEQFWKTDFSIELDFRTFYKNGLLLFAQSDVKHYNFIELKEGSIVFHVAGKRKKTLQVPKKLDDGEWHKLIIENKSKKRKRKVTITIDGRREKPKKIPQNKVGGDVFIGGIPQGLQQKLPKQLISKLTAFKGCIKELKINQAPQSFIHHHQIGLCFSTIERGSYFGGDTYVIYDRYFKVTNFLELKFQFRTREQNGILMSVSTVSNSPALSLELQNGAVVLSVDMGNGVVSNVTNFHSAYALCDNKWHNVTALFSTELTVNVDGVSKSWVISEMGLMDEIEDPLYIGGLPDIAPTGTLKIKENFKGCIRNVKIGDNYVDWVDMEELINVSLNSCPVT